MQQRGLTLVVKWPLLLLLLPYDLVLLDDFVHPSIYSISSIYSILFINFIHCFAFSHPLLRSTKSHKWLKGDLFKKFFKSIHPSIHSSYSLFFFSHPFVVHQFTQIIERGTIFLKKKIFIHPSIHSIPICLTFLIPSSSTSHTSDWNETIFKNSSFILLHPFIPSSCGFSHLFFVHLPQKL
jgi:hypothetical protein